MRKGHYKGKMFVKGMTPWNKGELLSLECGKCAKLFQVQPNRKTDTYGAKVVSDYSLIVSGL